MAPPSTPKPEVANRVTDKQKYTKSRPGREPRAAFLLPALVRADVDRFGGVVVGRFRK
jgi:hypothetical protein